MKKLLLFLLAFGFTYVQAQDYHRTTSRRTTYHHYSRHSRHTTHHHRGTSYTHHNIKVQNDAMDNPYHGRNSKQNDGVKKNEHRNMNYNTGQPLPPNNGR